MASKPGPNRIEVLIDGAWCELEGEARVGDLIRSTKVPSHVSEVTAIDDEGTTIRTRNAGRTVTRGDGNGE